MLERIKEVPFIEESRAVKVQSVDGVVVLERTDKVVWAREKTSLHVEGISCYVEAEKFFALLPDIFTLEQGDALKVTLKNGAKYELPFLITSWEAVDLPVTYDTTVKFDLGDLVLCTLKNLVKPELQCVYIDENGAVTCDFVSACVSKAVRATRPFLLPPDVQDLVDGRLCNVTITDDRLYFVASDFAVVTSKPVMSEDRWWESLRQMLSEPTECIDAATLTDALKRLSMFDDYVQFNGTKVVAGANTEPFAFKDLGFNKYEIEKLSKILSVAPKIGESATNLVCKNSASTFLLSPMEEA